MALQIFPDGLNNAVGVYYLNFLPIVVVSTDINGAEALEAWIAESYRSCRDQCFTFKLKEIIHWLNYVLSVIDIFNKLMALIVKQKEIPINVKSTPLAGILYLREALWSSHDLVYVMLTQILGNVVNCNRLINSQQTIVRILLALAIDYWHIRHQIY